MPYLPWNATVAKYHSSRREGGGGAGGGPRQRKPSLDSATLAQIAPLSPISMDGGAWDRVAQSTSTHGRRGSLLSLQAVSPTLRSFLHSETQPSFTESSLPSTPSFYVFCQAGRRLFFCSTIPIETARLPVSLFLPLFARKFRRCRKGRHVFVVSRRPTLEVEEAREHSSHSFPAARRLSLRRSLSCLMPIVVPLLFNLVT